MAFPIPSHLPRKSTRKDVATEILTKIDESNVSSLNSAVAASWVAELDVAIQTTQKQIHERIQNDMPIVERHLASSRSIQTRLQSLEANVHALGAAVTDSESGLVPILLQTLTAHSTLTREFAHVSTTFSALSHLHQLEAQCTTLEELVESGELCEAARAAELLDRVFEQSPPALRRSSIFGQLKSKARAVKDRAREQLGEALARSIVVTVSEILVHPSVQVRQSATVLQLPDILSSLDPPSLSTHLDTLRRDLSNHFIQVVLNQPTSCIPSSTSDLPGNTHHRLALFHAPPNDFTLDQRLEALSALLDFLSSHIFPALPSQQRPVFLRSLCKVITNSLLADLLTPNLPTSFTSLPPYLELAQQCIDFEDRYIAGLLDPTIGERPVEVWVAGLKGHYERQRRGLILDLSRTMVVAREDLDDTFIVEVDAPRSNVSLNVVAVQEVETPLRDDDASTTEVNDVADDAWGLDEAADIDKSKDDSFSENGWGFDDDVPDGEDQPPEHDPNGSVDASPSIGSDYSLPSQSNGDATASHTDVAEPDPSDAWGWNDADDGSPPTDESAWDDPWADEPSSSEPVVSTPPILSVPNNTPALASPSHKVATRLEKFSKLKKNVKKLSSPAVSSPLASSPLGIISPPSPPQPTSSLSVLDTAIPRTATAVRGDPDRRPPNLLPLSVIPRETFTVSGRIKRIVTLVEDTLREGRDFSSSAAHLHLVSSATSTSNILLQTAPEILDLYRALFPIKFQGALTEFPAHAMQFSNDCLYLSDEIGKTAIGYDEVKDRLSECQRHLKILGDSWYEDCIVSQEKHRGVVNDILASRAEGFTQSTEQEIYDEYESALTEVLSIIRGLSQKWKGILAKSKYYAAIGQVTDAALSRLLEDILALPDITEVESHRLSELCRILNALEALFVEDHADHPFTAAYVPSWLKFSYLSELLEASMADITYLFEEGALVDFEIEELVRLVQALFADTPLRLATITKLRAGHPSA